jgi:hypothetical protein
MSKYDEKVVERLIKAAEKWEHNLSDEMTEALEALRPKPEMEYVLCEFKPDWRDLNAGPMMYVSAKGETRSYSYSEWSYLREATRIPAHPKFRITASELLNFYHNIKVGSLTEIEVLWSQVADFVNSKQ